MRRATRITAALLGASAGIAGLEHGYFEILQGNVRPDSLMIASMGSPCIPEEIWNNCEPAMTIIPNFLITGILAIIIGLITLVWAAAFVQRKRGGTVLILLSITLLLFGGGLFPPLIGIIAGVVANKINKPFSEKQKQRSGGALRFIAKLWPWPLVVYLLWVYGQFLVGHFFNAFLQDLMYISLLLVIGSLLLSVYCGYACDLQRSHD
ncbi:MAG: hypothetical protein MUO76_01600 [Anaerolineaceae bacterium]|nr:hypothetical protein [Anaerolineaceae bacterium]